MGHVFPHTRACIYALREGIFCPAVPLSRDVDLISIISDLVSLDCGTVSGTVAFEFVPFQRFIQACASAGTVNRALSRIAAGRGWGFLRQ